MYCTSIQVILILSLNLPATNEFRRTRLPFKKKHTESIFGRLFRRSKIIIGALQKEHIAKKNPAFNIGKPRDKEYNPYFGYEPYWEGGDWVFYHKGPAASKDKTGCSSKVDCAPPYNDSGPICTRSMTPMISSKPEYKTFNSYCEMELFRCRDIASSYYAVHRGKCEIPHKVTNYNPGDITRNALKYEKSFLKISRRRYRKNSKKNNLYIIII